MAGSITSSPSSTQARKPGSALAHRAGPHRRADRHAREVARLGLAVAVVHRGAGALLPGAHHLGVERLAGGAGVPQRGERAQLRAAGDRAVLGGGHAEHVHALALEQLEPLLRVEAGVVEQRGGAAQPGGEEGVARRERPAAGRGAPAQVALPRAEPVLGLHALPGQVAVAVADRLGLAGGAGGEDDQRRVAGVHLRRGRGLRRRAERDRGSPAARRRSPPPRPGRGRARRPPRRADRAAPCARAGRPVAAARCTAARPPRAASRRASRTPTRGGCPSRSSPRRRGPRPGSRARPPCAPSGRPPRRSRSRAARRPARSPRARCARERPSRRARRSGSWVRRPALARAEALEAEPREVHHRPHDRIFGKDVTRTRTAPSDRLRGRSPRTSAESV